MIGLNFLLHSIKLVILNWKTALRISSPLIFTIALSQLFVGSVALTGDINSTSEIPWTGFIFAMGGQIIAGLWVAVAWHRFVLLEEDSGSLIPNFSSKRVLAYLMQGLILFFILFIVGLIVGIVSGLISSAIGGFMGVILATTITSFVILWVFYRYSPTLPAAALGETLSIDAAWKATKPYAGAILLLVLIMSLVTALLSGLLGAIALPDPIHIGILAIQTWLNIMVGISVLTTIYGVAVENRDL
ncbi:hypothetical protein [Cognatishimia activa]|uniref:hypothetical protein n=1 Tax=Cognatishimia activa TaxID=1715691 RepID=UPI00222F0449|nr:hypothetical protein [Cognatishimia activa]UZD90696.1 hypothetical protein M0D42_14060 [Cognatishimia activa]